MFLFLISFQDIAVLVDNTSRCDFYRSESFNVQPRQHCREGFPNDDSPQPFSEANTEEACTAIGGESGV